MLIGPQLTWGDITPMKVSSTVSRRLFCNTMGKETTRATAVYVPMIENVLFEHVDWHKMIIHPFGLQPAPLARGVWKRTARRLWEDEKPLCAREAAALLDVCLTRYSDAEEVGVGDQEPPLQFIDAHAAGPLRRKWKVLYVGVHFSASQCANVFLTTSPTSNRLSDPVTHLSSSSDKHKGSGRDLKRQSSNFMLILSLKMNLQPTSLFLLPPPVSLYWTLNAALDNT